MACPHCCAGYVRHLFMSFRVRDAMITCLGVAVSQDEVYED